MSRIGKTPVAIPGGVEITPDGRHVHVKGPKGTLGMSLPDGIQVEIRDARVEVRRDTDLKQHKACHGLVRSLIANMVEGVTKGYEKKLEIVGVGYRAEVQGRKLSLHVGFCSPVSKAVPDGLEVEAPSPTNLVIRGIDKQRVGQFAAEVRKVKPPEPYKGKGIKYADEVIKRKVAKAFGTA